MNSRSLAAILLAMIIDRIARAATCRSLSPRIAAAIDALMAGQLPTQPDGRYQLDDDRLIAILQTYPTKPAADGKWEAHRRYIDIQVILEGAELMDWAPIEEMTPAEPYDAERDVEFFSGPGRGPVLVSAGMFAIFHPADAHKPSLSPSDSSTTVRKLVFKVAT